MVLWTTNVFLDDGYCQVTIRGISSLPSVQGNLFCGANAVLATSKQLFNIAIKTPIYKGFKFI